MAREALRFHVVVPPDSRRRLRLLLDALFPVAWFRMYSLDVGGARAKIVRHLRRHERETVLLSPYRFAHAYLPALMPSHVHRILWLHTDVLVLGDVRELILYTSLNGAPAAAVEDCQQPVPIRCVNASHPMVRSAVSPGACGFDPGVLLVDVAQWALLDMTARIEYWQALNLRAERFFAYDDAHAALLLALLPVYARLPADWAVSVHRNATAHTARALHFSGPWKPWLRDARLAGSRCTHKIADPFENHKARAGQSCVDLWSSYASRAVQTLAWRLPTAAEAHAAAAAAAAAAVANHEDATDAIASGTNSLEVDAAVCSSSATLLHVAVVSGPTTIFGAVALINSTLVHASSQTRAALRFHIFTDTEHQVSFARNLKAVFSTSISVSVPPAERLAKLAGRLDSFGVTMDAFEMAPLWLQSALPNVPRVLLLAPDTIVLVDLRELLCAQLHGKACAVIEDCSVLFEDVYNYHHPLFTSKHARSSCTFDSGTILVDLKAWRKEEASARIIDLLGSQRRTEGLYAQPNGEATLSAPLMLALDKRAMRLPSSWLARGLARDAFTRDELRFWQRLYGQDGISIPYERRPYRAAHAVAAPVRDAGNALLLRFSGGPYWPWLRRCTQPVAAGAPRCGRSHVDCASLWRPYFRRALIATFQPDVATPDSDADPDDDRLTHSAQFQCVDLVSAAHPLRSGVPEADTAAASSTDATIAEGAAAGEKRALSTTRKSKKRPSPLKP